MAEQMHSHYALCSLQWEQREKSLEEKLPIPSESYYTLVVCCTSKGGRCEAVCRQLHRLGFPSGPPPPKSPHPCRWPEPVSAQLPPSTHPNSNSNSNHPCPFESFQ